MQRADLWDLVYWLRSLRDEIGNEHRTIEQCEAELLDTWLDRCECHAEIIWAEHFGDGSPRPNDFRR